MTADADSAPAGGRASQLAATVPASELEATAPGMLLHYRVLGKIGEGGMGAVFEAEDQRLARRVAIKLVAHGDPRESARARLLREARAASGLNHPNIVTVHAIEEVGDDAFLVMERLDGETLADLVARGPLDPARVAAVGADLADALAAAHAAGLVHRDLKPANVMITARGVTKLLDFGVAHHRASPSGDGLVVGTVPYMSPEQLRGRPLDGRSDVFSLGCLLYEAATGRRAFPAGSLDTLAEQPDAAVPPPPSAVRPGLPSALESIILRALASEPERRFTAAELAAALRGDTGDQRARPAPPTAPSSVAVLPFLDLSAERDQDYLCDGIADELISALTHIDGLRVSARSTAFQFKARPEADARAVGMRLGVDAVLEGSVRKVGEQLRVTVQLVDVVGGHPRWSHRFDGVAADVFAIQDQIAATTATLLRGELSATAASALRRPGTTPEAYEHFLRGRQHLRSHGTTSLALAERALERALALDPTYAPAHAALAQVHAFVADWHAGGARAEAAAERASARAVELGPELAETHLARAAVLSMRRDYLAAEQACLAAIAAQPQSFDAHYHYARVCFQIGRDAQAAELFQRCAVLRPEDYQSLLLADMPLGRLGRAAEAEASIREGLRRAEQHLELAPDDIRALTLGAGALVKLGDHERALAWIRRATARAADISDVGLTYNAACVYALLGEHEPALALLEQTTAQGFGKRDWIEHDTDLDGLRGEPRFVALLARLG